MTTLRGIARAIRRRDRVDAVVLAGTDLNLIFDEAIAGFPAFDSRSAHSSDAAEAPSPPFALMAPQQRTAELRQRGAQPTIAR
jgi:hypothetical protein